MHICASVKTLSGSRRLALRPLGGADTPKPADRATSENVRLPTCPRNPGTTVFCEDVNHVSLTTRLREGFRSPPRVPKSVVFCDRSISALRQSQLHDSRTPSRRNLKPFPERRAFVIVHGILNDYVRGLDVGILDTERSFATGAWYGRSKPISNYSSGDTEIHPARCTIFHRGLTQYRSSM